MATFEEGVPSVALSVTATGFDADAELEIVELVEGDFGKTRPRVVHIEPLQGRESFEIAAPESLRGTFQVMVLHNKTIDPVYSGMADAIVLTGQPVSISVAKGDSPAWMEKLPIGEAPENTIPDTPTPGPEGTPPEGNGPPGPPPAASE